MTNKQSQSMHSVDMHEIHRSDWFDADCVVMRRLGQQERLGHETQC